MNTTLTFSLATTLLAAVVGAQASVPDAVQSATGKARRDNQRVLLVVGDDGVREQLSGELRRLILYEYAKVELQQDDPYGQLYLPAQADGAFLAILDDRYQHIATAAVADLADVRATESFLTQNQATWLDANKVYDNALSVAKKTNRHVFVHLSAPW